MAGKLDAALELFERLVEVQIAGFQLLDQRFQLLEGLFEIGQFFGLVFHRMIRSSG